MRRLNQFEVLEEKVRLMADGFRSPEIPNTQLMFPGEEMLPMQVAQRLQGILDSFQGVRDAERSHRLSVAELERAMPHHAAFYEQAVEVAKSHFGSDPRRLVSFGLEVVKKPHRRHRRERPEREVVCTTVVEEVTIDPGRRPEVEVIETDTEVVEVVGEPERRHRRERHTGTRRAATVSRAPSAPVTVPTAGSKRGGGSASSKRGARR